MKRIEIYTDGAADRVSKRGGWGYFMVDGDAANRVSRSCAWAFEMLQEDEAMEKSGAESDTNLNRMKMMAMIHAAEILIESKATPDEAVFYSDSYYTIDRFSGSSHLRRDHKNYDLVQRFIKDVRVLEGRGTAVRLEWLEGNSRNSFIDRADALARVEMAGKPARANVMSFFDCEMS